MTSDSRRTPRPSGGGPRAASARTKTHPGAAPPRRPMVVEPVSPTAVTVPPRPRPRLTGRAAGLLVVVGLLVVTYAWPLREFLRQRSDLDQLRANALATQARVTDLEIAKQRWQDPAYVQSQARDRLHFVLPGEVEYTVLRPGQKIQPQTLPRSEPVPVAWFDSLWGSVQGADDPAVRPSGAR